MKWLLAAGAVLTGAVLATRAPARDAFARFRRDVRDGMDTREAQLREVLAMDTHLTLPGERVRDARAIEGR